MSPSRPVTAKRLPRLRTSFSVPVDSGSCVRSSYPSSSPAATELSVESATVLSRVDRRECLGDGLPVELQIIGSHAVGGPALPRQRADAGAVEELVGDA